MKRNIIIKKNKEKMKFIIYNVNKIYNTKMHNTNKKKIIINNKKKIIKY